TSISLAAWAGWNKGASLPESCIWTAAAIGLSLCSLAGVSGTLTTRGFKKFLAALVYMFGVTFTGISGLGSLNCGRQLASETSTAITQEHERLTAQYQRNGLMPSDSITSSALASRICGTVRPSVLAVLRLMECLCEYEATWRAPRLH